MEMEEVQESVLRGALKSSLLQPLGFPWSFLRDSRSAWLIHGY